tara:strand:+ start:45 stop:371 length:327 start_codon:yes stop_codon:yes gene_type:complete
MPKFKVDLNKSIYEQPYWNLLKPEIKLKHIKSWNSIDVDKLIATGEVVIDPTIPKRNMNVTIPDNQLTKGSPSYEQMAHKVKHMEKLILDLSDDVIELSKGKVLPDEI